VTVCHARLDRSLKNSEPQIPRGLKSARDDKNKGLGRGPEGPLYPSKASNRVFQRPVKACSNVAFTPRVKPLSVNSFRAKWQGGQAHAQQAAILQNTLRRAGARDSHHSYCRDAGNSRLRAERKSSCSAQQRSADSAAGSNIAAVRVSPGSSITTIKSFLPAVRWSWMPKATSTARHLPAEDTMGRRCGSFRHSRRTAGLTTGIRSGCRPYLSRSCHSVVWRSSLTDS